MSKKRWTVGYRGCEIADSGDSSNSKSRIGSYGLP